MTAPVEQKTPRILIIDIETFPNIGYIWGKYDQNVIRYTQQKCIATYSAKWFGKSKMISRKLPDYDGYKPGSYDDRAITQDIWKLFDEADIIVAHNGDQFDVKYCQARFIFHKMSPPSPFKTVDTKKVVKNVANFNSNSLDDLCDLFGLGRKLKTDFDLWEGCIKGDKSAWRKMVEYNEHDVIMLEKLYVKMLPWAVNHPNMTTGGLACPKCGSFDVNFRGTQRAVTRDYRRFQCQQCGGWGRTVKSVGKSIVQNIG
jgi:DNA polymerase elongation subunit (family B)